MARRDDWTQVGAVAFYYAPAVEGLSLMIILCGTLESFSGWGCLDFYFYSAGFEF